MMQPELVKIQELVKDLEVANHHKLIKQKEVHLKGKKAKVTKRGLYGMLIHQAIPMIHFMIMIQLQMDLLMKLHTAIQFSTFLISLSIWI